MKSKLAKRISFLIVLFIVPFSFFYLFSRGSHLFGRLPFYGIENTDGTPYTIPDFSFQTTNGTLQKADLSGKIIIATAMQSSCPTECDLSAKEFRFMVYQELENQKKFGDIMLITELLDTLDFPLNQMTEKLDVDPKRWVFYTATNNPIWDVELNGHKLKETLDSNNNQLVYKRSALLIDKEFHVRGWYDCAQTIEIKRLQDELRLLIKEYAQAH